MKLSELISFRNRLNEFPLELAKLESRKTLDILMHLISEPAEELTGSFVDELQANQSDIFYAFEKFEQTVNQIKQHVQERITEQEKHWHIENYKVFEAAKLCETNEQILYGRKTTGEKHERALEVESIIHARLSSYADWRYPGMIIRPGDENFINDMVGYDPLYLVDQNYDLLSPCMARFPKAYRNRLRTYIADDWSEDLLLGKIPDNQFGVCLVYNVFNYRPLNMIRRYLEEIYQKLRPGGVVLMTYNDCDQANAVMLVESYAASYTPGYLVRSLAKSIGFTVAQSWNDGGPSVWLELRKPGELTSLRGGQTIAKIHRVDDFLRDVDFLKRKVYTKQEIDKIHDQARTLNIDESIIEQTKPYDLQVLIDETLEKINQEQEAENKRKRIEYLKELAIANNIDPSEDNLEERVSGILKRIEEERLAQIAEEQRIAQELEQQRIAALHEQARGLDIDPTCYADELDLVRRIAEETDRRKKQELVALRQRAMELQAGDPNLIRYGYSAEKLKQLIKAKEEGQ